MKNTSAGEALLVDILKSSFPKAKYIEVQDISGKSVTVNYSCNIIMFCLCLGGCGAMYEIFVETIEFRGLNIVKQHRLVTDALKTQIKDMHGVRIHTKHPSDEDEKV